MAVESLNMMDRKAVEVIELMLKMPLPKSVDAVKDWTKTLWFGLTEIYRVAISPDLIAEFVRI